MDDGPVRIAVMDDYAVIVSGVEQMLAPYSDRVRVVELVSMLPVASRVDVLLYDTYSHEKVEGQVVDVIEETDAKVVLYTWNLDAELVSEALAKGAAGCLSKSLTADELVAALEKVHGGEIVVSHDPGPGAPVTPPAWPGMSNQEVGDRAYLSVNSVKTYIRSAYRKIGVERRTQAVLWATQHGFVPYPTRTVLGEDS
jgi:DNA-binding NarL/FixJ family response regulator